MKRFAYTFTLVIVALLSHSTFGQTATNPATDPTVLKQIIIFGRHSVRSPVMPTETLAMFTNRTYPDFGVPPGYLTPNGAKAATLLGTYFRAYLTQQGLPIGVEKSYFRSNSIQRSYVTAASIASGMFPNANVPINSYALRTPDPVFDPIGTRVAAVDTQRVASELAGIYNGPAISAALSNELMLLRSTLYNYPVGTNPAPAAPDKVTDPTAMPINFEMRTSNPSTSSLIAEGGLDAALVTVDPFVMQYANGMPMKDVAWGQLSPAQLSGLTRIVTVFSSIQMSTPYLNRVQSSNALAHIMRSMEQEATGKTVPGAFSAPGTNVLAVISSDFYVSGVASLLNLHWWLPGYQQDFAALAGSLVFELRQDKNTSEYLVRVYYTAPTSDQLRNLTPLTLEQPPATMQLLVPGGSRSATSLDVPFNKFKELVSNAISLDFVQNPAAETPPGPLTGVPLK